MSFSPAAARYGRGGRARDDRQHARGGDARHGARGTAWISLSIYRKQLSGRPHVWPGASREHGSVRNLPPPLNRLFMSLILYWSFSMPHILPTVGLGLAL